MKKINFENIMNFIFKLSIFTLILVSIIKMIEGDILNGLLQLMLSTTIFMQDNTIEISDLLYENMKDIFHSVYKDFLKQLDINVELKKEIIDLKEDNRLASIRIYELENMKTNTIKAENKEIEEAKE